MKRSEVLRRLRKEAMRQGKAIEIEERTKHTGVRVEHVASTLGRHREIPDGTARAFFDQFSAVLGKGWWRR